MATEPQIQAGNDGLSIESSNDIRTQLETLGKPIWDHLVYSSAYLAFIAMAEVLIVTVLLSLPLTPAPVVAALLTFAVYSNDRLADVETDARSAPERTEYIKRYQDVVYVLAALSYGIAVALSVLGGPVTFGLTLVPGVIWLLYAQDWVSSIDLGVGRLKDVFVLNSLVVAVAWSLVIVFLPVAFAEATVSPLVGVVFLFFTLATFVNTEIPNVRDMEGDRAIGVSTLPVVVGVRHTRHILYGITVVTSVLVAAAITSNVLAPVPGGALLFSLGCLATVVFCLGRVDDDGALALAAECTRLPVVVLFFLPVAGI